MKWHADTGTPWSRLCYTKEPTNSRLLTLGIRTICVCIRHDNFGGGHRSAASYHRQLPEGSHLTNTPLASIAFNLQNMLDPIDDLIQERQPLLDGRVEEEIMWETIDVVSFHIHSRVTECSCHYRSVITQGILSACCNECRRELQCRSRAATGDEDVLIIRIDFKHIVFDRSAFRSRSDLQNKTQ